MPSAKEFCTCRDTKCPNHPTNHTRGCELCVSKCLCAGEIPSCFFRAVGNIDDAEGYTYKDFAAFVLKQG